MFTGLIQTTGTVLSLKPTQAAMRLIVAAPELAGKWQIGDSIAVNGVCLTAVAMEAAEDPHPGRFAAELAEETIQRTTLSRLQPGAVVNLELPTLAGSRLGGHVVQGHVDATGKLLSLVPLHADLDRTDWRLTVDVPEPLTPYVLSQGSITIDGISLTVAKLDGTRVEIAVIPHTYRSTNLHSLLSGAEVNIETDVLAKYAAQLEGGRKADLEPHAASFPMETDQGQPSSGRPEHVLTSNEQSASEHQEWLTAEYLLANGY
jgi:riboflavin synthase